MREINKFHHHELMALCEFTIHGKPTGKMRPRACNRGGSTRVYSPKAQTDYEGMVAIIAAESIKQPPTDMPVTAVIIVACAKTDRSFVGIEKDQTYFELASRRIDEAYEKSEERD